MNLKQSNDQKMYRNIIQTARSLFINNGFDNTTIDYITISLQISDESFGKYFSSLNELLEVLWAGEPKNQSVER